MPNESEQDALSKLKAYLDAGQSFDAIRAAGWGSWIEHLEAKGYDLRTGLVKVEPPSEEPQDEEASGQPSIDVAGAEPENDRERSVRPLVPVMAGIFLLVASAILAVAIIRLTADTYNPLELLPDSDDPLEDLAVETCKDLGIATPSGAGLAIETGYVSASDEGFTADDLYEAVQTQCPESVPLLRLVKVAQDACLELDGAIVLQVGGILNRAISRAADLEFDGPDLGDAMRSECPGLMSAVEQVGEDQEEREREQERRERLPDLMSLAFECGSDNAYGAVRNDSNVTVDVFIEVQFLNVDGVLVDDSIDSISGLRPGETGYWDAPFLSRGRSWATCRAEVNSAFEQ